MKQFLLLALKKAANTAVLLLFVVIIYFLGASAVSLIEVNGNQTTTDSSVAIYIHTNGVHTDIVVPAKNKQTDWSKLIPASHTLAADNTLDWLAMGWGDKGFYLQTPTWYQLTPSVAFKALFHLGTSAMHTNYCGAPTVDETCRRILISELQYRNLVAYISSSFKTDDKGNSILIPGKHYNSHDAFYDAKGAYSLFYTCNTWANSALKACGQKASIWTPFDKAIFRWYEAEG